jgi:hypothetical protein
MSINYGIYNLSTVNHYWATKWAKTFHLILSRFTGSGPRQNTVANTIFIAVFRIWTFWSMLFAECGSGSGQLRNYQFSRSTDKKRMCTFCHYLLDEVMWYSLLYMACRFIDSDKKRFKCAVHLATHYFYLAPYCKPEQAMWQAMRTRHG